MTADEATALAVRTTRLIKEAHVKQAAGEAAVAGAPSALTLAGLGGMLLNNPITAGVGELSRSLGGYALPVGMAAPPVLGALAGHVLARSTDVDDETIKAIRKREVINEIRRNRQMLEQKRRTYRPTA